MPPLVNGFKNTSRGLKDPRQAVAGQGCYVSPSLQGVSSPCPRQNFAWKGKKLQSVYVKFTRDLIIVNYFKWKMLDTLVVEKRRRERRGKKTQ